MNTANSQPSHNDDEIDLFELVVTLWRSKGVIIAITLLCTILAGLVAFFVIKPTYQSRMVAVKPETYQVTALNPIFISFSDEKNELSSNLTLPQLTPEHLLNTLKNTMQSPQTLNRFFASIKEHDDRIASASGAIAASMKDNALTISTTGKNAEDTYLLTEAFLEYSQIEATKLALKNRQAELDSLKSALKRDITNIESALNTQNIYNLNELKNAYTIAQNLDIKKPLANIQDMYQLGTDVLQEKIRFAESTLDNYSQNMQHNLLTAKLASYEAFKLPAVEDVVMYNISQTASLPGAPIKPNKKLIIIIGFLLGGMLSVMLVLLRQAIRNYQLRSKAAQ